VRARYRMSSKMKKNPFLKNGGPKYTADSNKCWGHQTKFETNAGGVSLRKYGIFILHGITNKRISF